MALGRAKARAFHRRTRVCEELARGWKTEPMPSRIFQNMIRKLKSGEYRLYSKKTDAKTGKRRNLGTFPTREKAEQHERDVQYFKRAG